MNWLLKNSKYIFSNPSIGSRLAKAQKKQNPAESALAFANRDLWQPNRKQKKVAGSGWEWVFRGGIYWPSAPGTTPRFPVTSHTWATCHAAASLTLATSSDSFTPQSLTFSPSYDPLLIYRRATPHTIRDRVSFLCMALHLSMPSFFCSSFLGLLL